VLRLFYFGRGVTCPCCDRSFRAYAHWPGRRRAKICPACLSQPRHRLFWVYLSDQTDVLTAPRRVLDVGPQETLGQKLRRVPSLDYVSIDIEPGKAMRVMDVTDLRFEDESFDVIICSHVLEHVPDDRKAMAELYRVLKPDGWALLQVPLRRRELTFEDASVTNPRERARLFGQWDHVRYYGTDYTSRLEAAGFRVEFVSYGTELTPERAKLYGLSEQGERLIIGRRVADATAKG
jgi:SAM-dependent methyltransferase